MYFWDKHKTITSYYELLSGKVCDKYELTQMEYDILMFLYNNPQNNTAAEIVKIRKSTKSHVSTSLKNLENKKLIERKQSEENKKHVEIFLLDISARRRWGNPHWNSCCKIRGRCSPGRPAPSGRRSAS